MIALQSDVRVYLACGYTDMRKGMQGLAMLVQQVLSEDPFNGALYAFPGRRGGATNGMTQAASDEIWGQIAGKFAGTANQVVD